MADVRERARAALRFRREIWKLEREAEDQGRLLLADELDELATARVALADEQSWQLVRVEEVPTLFGPDGFPIDWETLVIPV